MEVHLGGDDSSNGQAIGYWGVPHARPLCIEIRHVKGFPKWDPQVTTDFKTKMDSFWMIWGITILGNLQLNNWRNRLTLVTCSLSCQQATTPSPWTEYGGLELPLPAKHTSPAWWGSKIWSFHLIFRARFPLPPGWWAKKGTLGSELENGSYITIYNHHKTIYGNVGKLKHIT